ncbi:hypothetical protein [Aliikangiella sp. IMCC44632]
MRFFQVLLILFSSASCASSTQDIDESYIVVTASFIKLHDIGSQYCSSADREILAQFQLTEVISGLNARKGEVIEIVKCYHNDFHPYAKEQVDRTSNLIDEHLLFLKKQGDALVELRSYELLTNTADEKAICPVKSSKILSGNNLKLSDMAFGQEYDISLSGASFALKSYYDRSRCYKVENNRAIRNKGIRISAIKKRLDLKKRVTLLSVTKSKEKKGTPTTF